MLLRGTTLDEKLWCMRSPSRCPLTVSGTPFSSGTVVVSHIEPAGLGMRATEPGIKSSPRNCRITLTWRVGDQGNLSFQHPMVRGRGRTLGGESSTPQGLGRRASNAVSAVPGCLPT